jgi:hypothetical protein
LAHEKIAQAARFVSTNEVESDAVVDAAPSPDDSGLASLARTLADFPLQVTADIAAQRQQLADLARQLDALLEGRTLSVEARSSSAEAPAER